MKKFLFVSVFLLSLFAEKHPVKVGDPAWVLWSSVYYEAKILKIEGEKYFITYPDYDSSYDEWVGPERILLQSFDWKEGEKVAANWSGDQNLWAAKVLQVDKEKKRVQLEYLDDSSVEWLETSQVYYFEDLETWNSYVASLGSGSSSSSTQTYYVKIDNNKATRIFIVYPDGEREQQITSVSDYLPEGTKIYYYSLTAYDKLGDLIVEVDRSGINIDI